MPTLGRRKAVPPLHQQVAALDKNRERREIAAHQHGIAGNGHEPAQQRWRAGKSLLQVVFRQNILQNGIDGHRGPAAHPRLAQALAQQAVGNIGPLLLLGRFFVEAVAGQNLIERHGVGRAGILNLEVVDGIQRLVLLAFAAQLFGLAQRVPGQARYPGLEQVLRQSEVAAHGGRGRGIELALAQQQVVGEMAHEALAQRVVSHGVGRVGVEPGNELSAGQGLGPQQQLVEVRVEAAGRFAALALNEHAEVAPLIGA